MSPRAVSSTSASSTTRVIIRGLNATYLDGGLPDGTSDLTGYIHTLTGVERVEVLKGPGSALYGSTEEGGTINLVHYRPSDTLGAGLSEQFGSFGTTTTDAYVTGPTGLNGVDFRLDGEFDNSDGFRGLANRNTELLASLSWRPTNHDVEFRYEYHNFHATPDATGIPFSPPNGVGQPLSVPVTDVYSSPEAFSDQTRCNACSSATRGWSTTSSPSTCAVQPIPTATWTSRATRAAGRCLCSAASSP